MTESINMAIIMRPTREKKVKFPKWWNFPIQICSRPTFIFHEPIGESSSNWDLQNLVQTMSCSICQYNFQLNFHKSLSLSPSRTVDTRHTHTLAAPTIQHWSDKLIAAPTSGENMERSNGERQNVGIDGLVSSKHSYFQLKQLCVVVDVALGRTTTVNQMGERNVRRLNPWNSTRWNFDIRTLSNNKHDPTSSFFCLCHTTAQHCA